MLQNETPPQPSAQSDELVRAALGVINEAIRTHRDDPIYGQFLQLSEKLLADREVGVLVYEGDPEHAIGRYTMQMQRGEFRLTSRRAPPGDVDWKVSREYLARVVENRAEYVEHPMRLDWDWLRSRMGLEH